MHDGNKIELTLGKFIFTYFFLKKMECYEFTKMMGFGKQETCENQMLKG